MLSDREQRAMVGIERRLVAQDPALAALLAPGRVPSGSRGYRWIGAMGGVLVGVVAPVVVLATVPALPAVVVVIVLALVGRVVAMCAVDDARSQM